MNEVGVLSGPDGPAPALIDKCVHCGFCLPTCPTYLLWGEEMDSPRGRIYLMKAGVEGRAELTPSFVTHMDNCLGCLACVTACPSGVQYGPLIERTRAQIERKYPRPAADRWYLYGLSAANMNDPSARMPGSFSGAGLPPRARPTRPRTQPPTKIGAIEESGR